MSSVKPITENPLNCSKHQYINDAYCISHQLFNKNNTCSHEPQQQTCYLNREKSGIEQSTDSCYEGFYTSCYIDDYKEHIKNNACVLAEGLLLEWCTCGKTNNGNETNSTIEKDCVCFPYHIHPYTIYNLKDKNKDTDTEESCVCSNIFRKKCNVPKDKTLLNTPIKCTTVDEALPLEQHMICDQPVYKNKAFRHRNRIDNYAKNPHWTKLSEFKKNRLIQRKNEANNSTNVVLSNSVKAIDNYTKRKKPSQQRIPTSKDASLTVQNRQTGEDITTQFPLSQNISKSTISENNTIDSFKQNLESQLDSLLTEVLGDVNLTSLQDNQPNLNVSERLNTHPLYFQDNNVKENKTQSLTNSQNHSIYLFRPPITVETKTARNYIYPNTNDELFNNTENLYPSTFGNVIGLPLSNTITFIAFPLLFLFIIIGSLCCQKIKTQNKFDHLELKRLRKRNKKTTNAQKDLFNDQSSREVSSASEENNLKEQKVNNLNLKKKINDSIFLIKNRKDDEHVLIINEETTE